jgi:hypothetical protein
MSRYVNRRRHLTFADTLERPGLLEDALADDFDRQLARFEARESEAEARADARERSDSWTYTGGEAA